MNLLLLCLVNAVLKLHGKKSRILASAALGAVLAGILAVTAAVFPESWYFMGSTAVIFGIVRLAVTAAMFAGMIFTAFGRRTWKEVLQIGALAGLAAAAAGGCFEAVLSGQKLNGLSFLLCAAGSYYAGKGVLLLLRKQIREKQHLYEVTLYDRGKELRVTALLDTGNHLYEPYGRQPVHVITEGVARQLCSDMDHILYIPFSAVGTEHGMLPGIRIDAMVLKKEGRLCQRVERPWLAISHQPLSVNQQYEMLLHGDE